MSTILFLSFKSSFSLWVRTRKMYKTRSKCLTAENRIPKYCTVTAVPVSRALWESVVSCDQPHTSYVMITIRIFDVLTILLIYTRARAMCNQTTLFIFQFSQKMFIYVKGAPQLYDHLAWNQLLDFEEIFWSFIGVLLVP